MSAEALLAAARSLAILALLLLLGQWIYQRWSQRRRERERVSARLGRAAEMAADGQQARLVGSGLERILIRGDIQLPRTALMVVPVAVLVLMMLTLVLYGVLVAVLVPVVIGTFLYVFWNLRYQKQRRTIFESLPGVIDDVIRNIDAGRSLEQALVEGFRDAPPVYERLSFRLRSAVESGRDYTAFMDDFADLYQVPPLVFVAVALRTSNRFGSSVRPVLQQVSEALRQQQDMRREFMAATAETRMTALAFAVLPIGIGVYVISMNESYREVLLDTDRGQTMLTVAVGLLLFGIVLIMRMIQGVGRG